MPVLEGFARTPTVEAAPLPPAESQSLPIKIIDINDLITKDAEKYGVSRKKLYDTLDCESAHFQDVTIQSGYYKKDGTRERSYGISQINLDAHTDISYEQAIDPEWAIDYAARSFAEGKASQWSCYNKTPR